MFVISNDFIYTLLVSGEMNDVPIENIDKVWKDFDKLTDGLKEF